MYKFNFKINEKDIYNSSMNFNKKWINVIFESFVTFSALVILVYSIVTKSILNFSLFHIVLLVLCVLIFTVIQPAIIYIKSLSSAKKVKDIEINMEFNDEKVIVSTNDENVQIPYENVYNFIKYKNMIVIMYDSIHGQIMPDRIFDKNKDEFYEYVATNIRNAREKYKEKNK